MAITVQNVKGSAKLCESGQELVPILYALSDFPGAAANTHYAYTNIQSFMREGIHLVCADSTLGVGWHKTRPYDPEAVIAEIEAVMDANPDARVFLRLHLNPPYWWLRDHPEECVVYRTEDGDIFGIDDGEQDRLIRGDDSTSLRVSLASKRWQTEAAEKLVMLLNAIKGTRAGRGLVAIQIAAGMFGEWHAWGRCVADVSHPMQENFKAYLEECYPDEQALRAAWADSCVSFDTARYSPEPFAPYDVGCFRDPSKSQRIIDSQKANQKAVTDAILHFAAVVKRTLPELLCGTFYGYYLCTEDTGVIGAHLNPVAIQDAEDIDFICGPYCYMENRKPEGVPMQRAFLESHRLRGKLWLTEMDQFPLGVEEQSGGTDEHFHTNVHLLRAATLQPIFGGGGFWFYDHRLVPHLSIARAMGDATSDIASLYRKRGWWNSPKMMAKIGEINGFAKKFSQREFRSDADVLIVFDAEAKYYRYTKSPNQTEYQLFEAVARCGVGYDCIYLSDLSLCEMERYRCIIFADCPNVTPEMRALIEKQTKGKLCVFLHGSGFCDGERLSVDAMSKTVGMEIGIARDIQASHTTPSPAFRVIDTDVEPITVLADGSISAAKKGSNVYISDSYLTKEQAKKVLKLSGAHVWCESDEPVIASSGYLMVVCQRANERAVHFPDGTDMMLRTSGYETAVIDIGTKSRVL